MHIPEQDYICPDCDGKKKIKGIPCDRCKGTGIIRKFGYDEIVTVAPAKIR
jgi:DnaJ-class molecular chaperone